MNFLGLLFQDDAFGAYLDEAPLPNVAIVGGSASARQIVAEGIRQSQTSQSRFRVQLFSVLNEILPKKPPHASYEGHKLNAVFKRNWCLKHLQRVFGCVALLVDWDNVKIGEKHQFEQHIAQLVDAVRSQVRNSASTRVMLVLITKLSSSDSPPGGLYATSEDAQSALRNKLGLDSKSLAVIYRDGVDEYSLGRLQRMISDHCVKYHRDEIAKIKRMKGDAHKAQNAALLQARLRFKAGWHCLVLQDHKLMKYNLEKGYDVLQQHASGANIGISERVASTTIMWMMVASNFNQLAAASSPKPELILEMLEVTVSTFLRHLVQTVSQPYGSSFVGSLDQGGVHLLQIVHQLYLAEWYEMLAKKIQFVLEAHRIVPKRQQMSINPGLHFQTASRWWELVQSSVKNMGGFTSSSSSSSLSPLLHLGTECRSPAAYLRPILARLTVSFTSNKIFELVQNGMRYLAAAGVPRAMLRVLYGVALHFYTIEDYVGCYEKIRHVLQSGASGGTVLCDTIFCALHKLMIQACRKITRRCAQPEIRADDNERQPRNLVPEGFLYPSVDACQQDAAYMHNVGVDLINSMLSLIGNRCVDAEAQKVIQNELSRLTRDGAVSLIDGAFHMDATQGPKASSNATMNTFSATAFFSKPFAEARGINDKSALSPEPTVEISVSTMSQLPVRIVQLRVEVCRVTATRSVPNASGLRASEAISYTSTRDESLERTINRKLERKRKLFETISSNKSARIALNVSFCEEGVYEIPAVVAHWLICDDPIVVLPIRICIAQPANYSLHRRLETHIYEPSLEHWDSCLNVCNPRLRNRPVVRVVKPISALTLQLFQAEQAVEGEEYPVEVVVTNTHASLRATELTLLVPWIPGTVDVLQESSDGKGTSVFSLAQVSQDDQALRLLTPEGYEMSAGTARSQSLAPGETLRARIYFRCHKGGKFELPVRLHYATEHCAELAVARLFTLHVCHPVFVTFHLLGSQQGSIGGVTSNVPSDAQMLQFMESSVLRDANTVIGDELSQYPHLGRMARIDNDFLKRHDGTRTGFVTFSNMLYTVEHMQMPSESRNVLEPPIHWCDVPLYVSCKFSNSLQCALTIVKVDVKVANNEGVEICGSPALAADWEGDGILPCTLGVDEDLMVGFSVICKSSRARQNSQLGLGSLMLHLKRTILTKLQQDGDDTVEEESAFTFELPLPALDFSAVAVSCSLDVPPTVITGEAFYAVLRMDNASSEPKHVEVSLSPSQGEPHHPPPIIVGGRGRWSTTISPGEGKKTALKLFPSCCGVLALPSLSVRCAISGTVFLRPDERRTVVSLPATQQ